MNRPHATAMLAVVIGAQVLGQAAVAAEIRVGVAANFASTLALLAEHFEQHSGHRLLLSSGSTGKLFAQIKNGAPFDLFFAADAERPQRLEREGDGVPGTRFTYAIGHLVLWSPRPGKVDAAADILNTGEFNKLAIANPATAPYGLAARQTLQRLGVWQALQSRIVRGENIAQTYQFVASGNADLGFVALAQMRARDESGGSSWQIPPDFHAPIDQQVILLRKAREPAAARALLAYLRQPHAQQMLRRAGYGVTSD